MAIKDNDEGLTLHQEGPNVRAVAEALDILFPKSEREAITRAYNDWRPKVLSWFENRWREHTGANIAEADLAGIVREVTLHWMGFCVMHRMPVQMGDAERDQPQTRRIIRAAVERRFARGSEEATALCAQLMGISREAYLKWAQADESFLGIM